MKHLALLALSLVSFSSFAQNLDRQIQDKMDRLNNNLQRGALNQLSRMEKDELDNHLKNALRTLRDSGDNRPGPGGPGPGPGFPGPGPSRRDTEVKILISGINSNYQAINNLIDLSGRNPGDMLVDCSTQLRASSYFNVSAIIGTVNNENYFETKLTGNYPSADAICSTILSQVDISRPLRPSLIDVSGVVSGINSNYQSLSASVNLRGTRGTVMEQCVQAFNNKSFFSVSSANLSVNSGRLQDIKSSMTGNYPSMAKICGGIFSLIDANVR